MTNHYVERIERFLEDHQVEEYRFEQRAKHIQIKGTSNGVPFCVTFPKTGSDWRGPLNAISDLRHAMGLVGAPANDNAEPKPTKRIKRHKIGNRTRSAPVSSLITEPVVFVDRFYAPLQIIRERLVAAASKPQGFGVNANPSEDSKSTCVAPRVEHVRLVTPWLGKRARFTEI